MKAKKDSPERFAKRGRLLMVDGVAWRWRCGKGGTVVAYNKEGERRTASASDILGTTPDNFERGQWKKTSDGMLCPADVALWIKLNKILTSRLL